MRNIGWAIGTALFTGVITSTTGASGYPSAAGHSTAFLMLTTFAVIGIPVALAIPRRRQPTRRSSHASRPQAADTERVVTAPVNVWSAADEDWQ